MSFSPVSVDANRPRIVILGAGFGGLQTAQSLRGVAAEVVLIDRHRYHTFVPLLYQVTSGQLDPSQVICPIPPFCRAAALRFWQADIQAVDLAQQRVDTDRGSLAYDYLVIATGSTTGQVEIPGVAEFGFKLRSLPDALRLRRHLFHCLAKAVQLDDPAERQRLLTIAIAGGGATGVEVAGTVSELFHQIRRWDYPELGEISPQIHLIQAGDRLLGDLPAQLGRYTARVLPAMGVTVHLNRRVQQVSATGVQLDGDDWVPASTVVWTVGLQGNAPFLMSESPSFTLTPGAQLAVSQTLQLPEWPQVYAIGDVAAIADHRVKLTGVAPEALQAGVWTAKNLRRQLRGQAPQPFRYWNKGRLAIIGRGKGVGQIGPIALTGWLPWLLWLAVHWVYLPNWRNRWLVLLNWIYGYLSRDRPRPYR